MSLTFENPKDPADIAVYSLRFEEAEADPITEHRVRVVTGAEPVKDEASDLTIVSSEVQGDVVLTMVAGGSIGRTYRIEFEVELSSGQRFNREAKLKVKNL